MLQKKIIAFCLLIGFFALNILGAQVLIETDFENTGIDGWAPRGDVTLELSNADAYSGESSLKVSGRTSNWHGASYALNGIIEAEAVYRFTCFAKLVEGEPAGQFNMTIQRTPLEGDTAYETVGTVAGSDKSWIELTGEYSFSGEVSDIFVYIENSEASAEYYIDGFKLEMLAPAPDGSNTLVNVDFENGSTSNWGPRGSGVVTEVVSGSANSGTMSLKVSGRTSNWHGAQYSLNNLVFAGGVYQVKLAARLVSGQAASSLSMTVQRTPLEGDTAYDFVASSQSDDISWVQLSGNYTFSGDALDLLLYVESEDPAAEYYIDDFSLVEISPPAEPEADGSLVKTTFETGTIEAWSPRGDSVNLVAATDDAYEGDMSLKVTGRSANWQGASYSLNEIIVPLAVYRLSAYVKLVEGQAADSLSMTVQRTPISGDSAYEFVAGSTVDDSNWVKLTGSYTFSGDISDILVYIECAGSVTEYYIDDFTIEMVSDAPEDQSGLSCDFEDGTFQGWKPRIGGELIVLTDADAHSGIYSLEISNRMVSYEGASINVLNKINNGSKYSLSLWVKLLPGFEATDLRLSIYRNDGTDHYETVVPDTLVSDQNWVQLKGTYTLSYDVNRIEVYIESAGDLASFYIDDFELSYIPPMPVQTDIPSLAEVLKDYFPIGAAIEPSETMGPHGEILKKHFNSITAGNVMKPETLQPVEGQFNFEPADTIVNFVNENNIALRGHTLLWHSQVPDWFFLDKDGNEMLPTEENRELLISRLKTHITTVVNHFKGTVKVWDVVNEVIDTNEADNLRHSKWYNIIGPEYIDLAFQFAREADPDAELIINDYSTTNPVKRNALFALVSDMLARGIPVDGVGHQFHININSPSIQSMRDTIELFAGLGLDNQITEMDMSVYTNSTDSYETIPEELLIQQAYRYADVFDLLRELSDVISSVTIWGISDDNTWLKSFPITRLDLPLLFDEALQAKPAYWAVVDKSQLPTLIRFLETPEAVNGPLVIDGRSEINWDILPWESLSENGSLNGKYKTLWKKNKLYLYIDIKDNSLNRDDLVEIFIDPNNSKSVELEGDEQIIKIKRWSWMQKGIQKNLKKTDEGYSIELAVPLQIALQPETAIGFDIRVTNADKPEEVIAWNDYFLEQEKTSSRYGTLVLKQGVSLEYALQGSVVVDGKIDKAWKKARTISTGKWVTGSEGATAVVKTLWNDDKLYVLAEVTDPLLSDLSANSWEQDSIEIFLDQNNGKTDNYESDDGQYRVNFNNLQTYGGLASEDNFETAVVLTETGYVVEAAITLDPQYLNEDGIVGFDFQVNDDGAGDGVRSSASIWHDTSGSSYMNTSHFGALSLVKTKSWIKKHIPFFNIKKWGLKMKACKIKDNNARKK
ncbi:MAG: endo-1,4-beta-xylanase [Spirochaetales bacterium]|nr:endo-1,4-beta-xylanase [Spirochaetales bacterium]